MSKTQKTVDIFIKSYSRDFWLLQISLKTLIKNVSGYNNIIILIPENEKELFDTRELPERTLVHYVEEYGNTYLLQQVFKLQAYKYCFADYIMFCDSDLIYEHEINVQDLIVDDKPEILFTDYNKLPDAIIWKEPTEKFIKDIVQYEFMRRLPLVYHRETLINIDKYAPDLENTVMCSQRYSEFNTMGVYAYTYEREKYNFINTDDWQYIPPHATQVWSYGSKADGADALHLREYIRILETIMIAFNVPVPKP